MGCARRVVIVTACGLSACQAPELEHAETTRALDTCITVDAAGVRDAMLSNPPRHQNYGAMPILRVGGKDEALVAFGLDAIPADAVIEHATLTLHANGVGSEAPITLHRATAAWDEAIVTYDSFAQAYAPAPDATLQLADGVATADVSALVQDWVSGDANHGVLVSTSSKKKTIFASSEADDVARRPTLDVCYTQTPSDPCLASGGSYGPLAGDYTVTDAASLAALVCVDEITGVLTIAADAAQPVAIPSLRRVRALHVASAASLDLPNLETVTLDIVVRGATLEALAFGALHTVGRTFEVGDNPALDTITLPALLVHGSFAPDDSVALIYRNAQLTAIDAPLATLARVHLEANPLLTRLQFVELGRRVRHANIVDCPSLFDIGASGFSNIEEVVVDLRIHNTGLSSLGAEGLSNLVSVDRELQVSFNQNLASLGPTSLASLVTQGSDALGGTMLFANNPLLAEIDAPHATVRGVYAVNHPLLTRFVFASTTPEIWTVELRNNPLLTELGPNGLSSVRETLLDITIDNTPLATLGPRGLSDLVRVGRAFRIAYTPLTSLGPDSLAALTSIGATLPGGLDVFENPALAAVRAPALASIEGRLYVDHNLGLHTLALDALTHIGGNITITRNTGLPTCFAALLAQLVGFTGTVTISDNGPACP